MAITQIPISNFVLTTASNEFGVRQVASDLSDLSDSDNKRRREAKRSGNPKPPRMRQPNQENQSQRLAEAMRKEHSPALRSPQSLVSPRSLTRAMSDLLAGGDQKIDDSECTQPKFDGANTRSLSQSHADQKTFRNHDEHDIRSDIRPGIGLRTLIPNDDQVPDKHEALESGKNLAGEPAQPFDIAARLAGLGSMQGKGKTHLTVRQLTEQFKDMANDLLACKKGGLQLSEEESDQLAYIADFSEGYCEESQMDTQTRSQFDASLQSLRANLNPVVQASVAAAMATSGDTGEGLVKPASIAAPRQRAAREALIGGGVKEDGLTQTSAGIERSRRASLAQDKDEKHNADTLPLLVQRSV